MRIIASVEDYKIVKKILDYLEIYESQRKRPHPKIHTYCDEFDDYIKDDYIDCDFVCWVDYKVTGYLSLLESIPFPTRV